MLLIPKWVTQYHLICTYCSYISREFNTCILKATFSLICQSYILPCINNFFKQHVAHTLKSFLQIVLLAIVSRNLFHSRLKAHDVYVIHLNCLLDGEIPCLQTGSLLVPISGLLTSASGVPNFRSPLAHLYVALLKNIAGMENCFFPGLKFILTLAEISRNEPTSYRRQGSNVFFFVPA